ncbi:MAG: UDP-N-acetylglucosamine 1-carboxyvinyltransferase [Actinobacteria bacterium]|nr:UDP-N-acetylglucosamine 1-carboxyvinyltransferase [Actinomycetota bacterium]MBU4240111.1 UDP-N-acetylglucosamine 1-carboxyvinyltransferase [Actinomycetota bacterium]MBU4302217.1 UDP-N-acetylglucosamine 1-carboxyvinyltransferase [Actinomycetota bacterium]MBU4386129.1 UDP-N-acetylglucosamine 1-carboxyvinyltransferase [Actinomycetota bacterium]
MEKLVIEGGGQLSGTVRSSGAKNSALKLMAAALMAGGPCVIHNVPDISDVHTMAEVLRYIGLSVTFDRGTLDIAPADDPRCEAPYHLVQRMRASVEVLGPLISRYGRARVAMPGGCNIGTRQIDMHLKGLTQLGARLGVSHGFVEAEAGGLTGAHMHLDFASMGATENLLMAGVLAEGRTVIENAAKEPEVVDLVDFLTGMGARITGGGTSTLVVDGVDSLSGVEHAVIGDRIEAGTFLLAGAITRGEVEVTGVNPGHLEIVVDKMGEAGCRVDAGEDCISVSVPGGVSGIELSTLPYPGFPTDLQPQMLVLLCTAGGTSFVTENIFDNRFMVVDEINRLGADIRTKDHHAIIKGVTGLSGAPVSAPDLRAGAALVLAGLIAEGTTVVYQVQFIDRGYERFEEKLNSLGARVRRAPV